MKRLTALALLPLCCILMAGCSDDPASGSNQTENGSVSATIAGGAWSATNVQASWTSNVLAIGGAQIQTSGNRQINISGLVSAPGTYQLNPFTGMIANYSEGSATGGVNVKIFSATSGTLVVDKLTSSGASGSFTFEAKDSQGGSETRSVTNGKFDVKF